MRVQRPLHYTQVTEALPPGVCPLCPFLRDFQAACVRESDAREFEALCNFHMWAFAEAGQAESTARLFLRFPARASLDGFSRPARSCAICQTICDEESRQLDEFAEGFTSGKFREWMSLPGAVCLPHAARLLPRLSDKLRQNLASILTRRIEELKDELQKLILNAKSGQRATKESWAGLQRRSVLRGAWKQSRVAARRGNLKRSNMLANRADCISWSYRHFLALRVAGSGTAASRDCVSGRDAGGELDGVLAAWRPRPNHHQSHADFSGLAGGHDDWLLRGIHDVFKLRVGNREAVGRRRMAARKCVCRGERFGRRVLAFLGIHLANEF